MKDDRTSPFRDAHVDRTTAREVPDTPQTRAPSYKLAFDDFKFLMLKGPDEDGHKVESNEHMQKFWHWLAEKGISSHRSAIVLAIAEKMNTMMPGIYDPSDYDDDEE